MSKKEAVLELGGREVDELGGEFGQAGIDGVRQGDDLAGADRDPVEERLAVAGGHALVRS